jgi:hypothetical protein
MRPAIPWGARVTESDRAVGAGRGAEAPRVRAAVLRTTIAELLRTGYAGLSVEAVAERASVHKTSTAASSPRGTDPDLLIEALIAPLYLRLLVLDRPIGPADAERIVDLVLDGATGPP